MDDWAYCREALQKHSRTFAIPTSFLTGSLQKAVTCAYLLCRIADTIEDTAAWSAATKEALFRSFLDALEAEAPLSPFPAQARSAPRLDSLAIDEEELVLIDQMNRIMSVFRELEPASRVTCRSWVAELTRGMSIYSQRRPGTDGIICVDSLPDLERYCYFVAGTIGRLLTELFVPRFLDLTSERKNVLHETAESFGAGLQLVNIIRDITVDLQRGCCFVPRTLLASAGLTPSELVIPDKCDPALSVLSPLFELAGNRLDAAFRYALSIPAAEREIRTFVLIPLWLAVATLKECRDNAELLQPGRRIKLSKQRVGELVAFCLEHSSDDPRLELSYAQLG